MKPISLSAAGTAVGRRITYANVASTLALVIALGTGTAYAANTIRSGDIVDGQVKTADLAKNAVKSTKIADANVKRADLAGGSVTSAAVALDSLTQEDLANSSVGRAEIATDGVGDTEILDDSIDGGEIINNSLTASDIAANAIASGELASNAVTSAKVANNSLTTADLAGTDSLGSISLGAGSVPNGRCEDFAMTVGGSQVGQGIIVSARAAIQEGVFLYGGSVLADGQGTLVVCNLSGGAMAALVDFPIRTITFD
jgi:hypothetical protein